MNFKSNHNNWQIIKLNEICIIRSGIFTPAFNDNSSEGSIPYIKPADIYFNIITHSKEKVSEDILSQSEVEIMPKESILISACGSNAGNIALLGKDAIVNKNVLCTTIHNPVIKPKFLYYYLFLKRHMFVKVSKYTLRVSYRYLQKLDIPLPSLKEQNQIIQQLDTGLNQLNVSINHLKKSLVEIKKNKQALLNHAFLFNPKIPLVKEWKILKLKDCGIINAGKTPNGSIREYYGSDYPLFKPTDLYQETNLKSAETYLSLKGLKEARYVSANSLLICYSGINFGKVGITKVDGACNQQMISYTPNDKFIPEFIYFQMNTDSFRQQLSAHSKNSVIKKSIFKNLSLMVTNVNDQRKILNKICSGIRLLAKEEVSVNKKLRSLENAKTDLLLRSFTKQYS